MRPWVVLVAAAGCLPPLQGIHHPEDRTHDWDGDGFTEDGGDCNDRERLIHPGAAEVCNDVDDDCNGTRDDEAIDGRTWFLDADRDGWGSDETTRACGQPVGHAEQPGDCDDGDPTTHPEAAEVFYDGQDSDCAEGDDFDQDGDGQQRRPEGTDCDDLDPSVFLGAVEIWYDGVDSDCSGDSDYDQDGDRFLLGTDCDDTDPQVFPTAPEIWYDDIDQACDGGDDHDQDGDGFQAHPRGTDCDDLAPTTWPGAAEHWYDGIDQDCSGDSDFDRDGDTQDRVPVGTDCDDSDPTIFVGAVEIWYDGTDQDCSGGSDFDKDGDGYVRVPAGQDCDDEDAHINPGVLEIWYDGIDQNCDGANDNDQDGDGSEVSEDCDDLDPEWFPVDYWPDRDRDGFGDPEEPPLTSCSQPLGFVDNADDCDDTNPALNPLGDPCVLTISELGPIVVQGAQPGDAIGTVATLARLGTDSASYLAFGVPEAALGLGTVLVLEMPLGHPVVGLGQADIAVVNTGVGGHFGSSMAAPGDVQGDGFDDLLVGSGLEGDSGNGAAHLLHGPLPEFSTLSSLDPADRTVFTATPGLGLGRSVSGAGDVDGDLLPDLFFGLPGDGTPSTAGGAAVVLTSRMALGGSTFDVTSTGVRYTANQLDDRAGLHIDAGLDFTMDGVPDLVVGAHLNDSAFPDAGAVYVLPGDPLLLLSSTLDSEAHTKCTGSDAGDELGTALDLMVDIQGDGLADLVVGSAQASVLAPGGGGAWLISGSASAPGDVDVTTYAAARIGSEVPFGGEGLTISNPGNVDSQGFQDVALSFPAHPGGGPIGSEPGRVYLFTPPLDGTFGLDDAWRVIEGMPGDALGPAHPSEDMDGDGTIELLLGAPGAGAVGEGFAYVVPGASL